MIVPIVDLLEIGIGAAAVIAPMAYDMYKEKDEIKDILEFQKKCREKKEKEKKQQK